MNKKINFIHDMKWVLNTPMCSRLNSFKLYFNSKKFAAVDKNKKLFFISMPPFCNFNVFFKHKNKIILDIRDGWSIAQASGYGGNVKRKPVKAFITRIIERFIIRRSFITITCTPGLVSHLEKISGKKIILIPNGISDERVASINAIKDISKSDRISNDIKIIFSCAGQFSEYGVDKVKKLLNVIASRYPSKELLIQLIGSDQERNAWVNDYFTQLTAGRGKVEILPRMAEEKLLKTMLNADYGLTILRDPDYELGTKVYDYIALGLPIVNYFDEPNNFTDYFDNCLDLPFGRNSKTPEIRRSILIEQGLKNVQF